MTHSRREFMRRAALLTGAAGLPASLGGAIERALAVEPEPGSTWLDAEHVVILMQENRSFDHTFGALRGVRGFSDPRAITLPDGNPVWVQTDEQGARHVPFRLDMAATNATWLGCLPHSWPDQLDASNHGRHDRWLQAKRPSGDEVSDHPLTLGHHTREDLPFYYALADAFTIFDQHFSSALAGTTANRLHLWSGALRGPGAKATPRLLNDEADHDSPVDWTTFPERLESLGVSWKVYQNEVSIPTGLSTEEAAWLGAFGDNPLEYCPRFNVRLSAARRAHVERMARTLSKQVAALEAKGEAASELALERARAALKPIEEERAACTAERLAALSAEERRLHARAFTTNVGDPDQRRLRSFTYDDGGVERTVQVPAGDVLHQLREDCRTGALPAVSWLVAPERLSDHPGSAWYGAWYVAEVLDILARDPARWKKTIFLLTYDENDGFFDHAPPFRAADPARPESGRASAGIDTGAERARAHERVGPVGLGFRVPLIVASPWSRGGAVCSQVSDHTSSLRMLETWLTRRLGREVREPNISAWRRTVCGDLGAGFRTGAQVERPRLPFPVRDSFFAGIHAAKDRPLPARPLPLTDEEVEQLRRDPRGSPRMPRQEPGVRPSCPLPYELAAEGRLGEDRTSVLLRLEARRARFGAAATGAPFTAYARRRAGDVQVRDYAVTAGDRLEDAFLLADFEGGRYDLALHGPNGFFRALTGDGHDPHLGVRLDEVMTRKADGPLAASIVLTNAGPGCTARVVDLAYGGAPLECALEPGEEVTLVVDARRSAGWYSLGVSVAEHPGFSRTYAGRIETGRWSTSDPALGRT